MTDTVRPDSLVTLYYRVALNDDTEIISTFGSSPATLQLGSGELAPPLERCLIDLPVGQRHVFLLEAAQAFGPHNPQLVERRPRTGLSPADPGNRKGCQPQPEALELKESDLVEFRAPDGSAYAGLVRELGEDYALVDFNHPLAGKSIRFEVEIVGIL